MDDFKKANSRQCTEYDLNAHGWRSFVGYKKHWTPWAKRVVNKLARRKLKEELRCEG